MAVLKARSDVNSSLYPSVNSNDFASAQAAVVSAGDEVGIQWKTDTLSKLANASIMMAETGINPYITRQDYDAYDLANQRAVDGDLTETEIEAGIGSKWTMEDGASLRKTIAGETNKAQDQDHIRAFSSLKERIALADSERIMPNAVKAAQIQGRNILEDEIANAETPLRGKDLQIATNRIIVEMKRRVEAGFTADQLLPVQGEGGTEGRIIKVNGEAIGAIDDVGRLVLNRNGVRRLYRLAGKDKKRAIEIAGERGFIIPGM